MIADTLSGRLPVERVQAARPLVEMMFSSVTADAASKGGGGGSSIIDLVVQAKIKASNIHASYETESESIDVTPVREVDAAETLKELRRQVK